MADDVTPTPEVKPVEYENKALDAFFDEDSEELTEHPLEDPAVEKPLVDETPEKEPELEKEPEKEPETEPGPEAETEPAAKEDETKPPIVETKPEAKRDVGPWKQLHEQKKLIEKLEKEIAARSGVTPTPPAAPTEDEIAFEDPMTQALKRVDELEARLKEKDDQAGQKLRTLEERDAQRTLQQEILDQEAAFTKDNPDYKEALNYLTEQRAKDFEEMGAADGAAEWWLTNNHEQVVRAAIEAGKNPDSDADLYETAKGIGLRLLLQQDRAVVVQACRTRGRSIPKFVYDTARRYGFNGKPVENPEQIKAKETQEAQERVQRAVKQESVTTTLSTMQPKAPPVNRSIETRAELQKYLSSVDEEESDAYVAERDEKDPGWLNRLI